MDEQPLFHRAKWTANDRQCLVREIERGGEWVERAGEHLGRSPGGVLREARRMADMGAMPARLRSEIYAARLRYHDRHDGLTPARRERMRQSFEALSGHPIREQVVPKQAERTPEGIYLSGVLSVVNVKSTDDVPDEYINVKSTDDVPEQHDRWDRFWRWIGGE